MLPLLVLLAATAQAPSRPASAPASAPAPTVAGPSGEKLDRHFTELAAKDFSGVVLVAHRGELVLAKGYGLADRGRKVAYTTETVFDIGSITKQFTATAILALEREGKLRVTDALPKYFAKVPEDKQAITLHQLLTHTAGFADALGEDDDAIGREEFVRLALASKLRAKPGARYAYSNVGYSLLGAILEQVTGESYEKALRERVLAPAGLARTGYRLPRWEKESLARGYERGKEWGSPLEHPWAADGPHWHLRANGGLLSTVGDLWRWAVVLEGEQVVPRDAKEKLFTPYVSEGPGSGTHYGYGWSIGKTPRGGRIWAHDGSNDVFFADFRLFPDDRLVLVLATNATGDRYADELGRVATMVLGE